MTQNADRKVLVLWLITVGMITVRELKTPGLPVFGMPRPSAYVGSAVVFGSAAILAEVAPDLAVVFALGWTIAIAYDSLSKRAGTQRGAGGNVRPSAERTAA